MQFRSKVDTWLRVVLLLSIVMTIAGVAVAVAATPPSYWLIMLGLILPVAALPVWVLLSTHYTFTDNELVIRSGPMKWRVPLDQVHSVTPTRNPLSSPALSLDRLRIEYGTGKSVMISPEEKEQFVRELERRKARAKNNQ